MEKTSEEFPGGKYYNKLTLSAYFVVMGLLHRDLDPEASLIELAVETGFMVAWTFTVGLVAYFMFKQVIAACFKGSKLDEATTNYVAWIVPSIGFLAFLATIYDQP